MSICRYVFTLVAALALLALPACSDDGKSSPDGAVPEGPVTQVEADRTVSGLCEMLRIGRRDRDALNDVFFDQSHAGLHRIAADAQSRDRAATGLLLERKQLVENDLLADPIPKTFDEDIDSLVHATSGALRVIDLDAPRCDG
ncbi:MAG: hypothetical protein WEA10_09625 [Actinomycetota bacterium]